MTANRRQFLTAQPAKHATMDYRRGASKLSPSSHLNDGIPSEQRLPRKRRANCPDRDRRGRQNPQIAANVPFRGISGTALSSLGSGPGGGRLCDFLLESFQILLLQLRNRIRTDPLVLSLLPSGCRARGVTGP